MLSRAVSKLFQIIGQIYVFDRVTSFNTLVWG